MKIAGSIGTILSLLVLSLELYSLRLLQALEQATGRWYSDPWKYACEGPCAFALIITIAVLIYSLYLLKTARHK